MLKIPLNKYNQGQIYPHFWLINIYLTTKGMAFNLDSSPEVLEKSPPLQLTQEQLTRIDANRKRALEIKKTKENAAKMYLEIFFPHNRTVFPVI